MADAQTGRKGRMTTGRKPRIASIVRLPASVQQHFKQLVRRGLTAAEIHYQLGLDRLGCNVRTTSYHTRQTRTALGMPAGRRGPRGPKSKAKAYAAALLSFIRATLPREFADDVIKHLVDLHTGDHHDA